MKKLFYLLTALIIIQSTLNIASAQSWQWGKRAGSNFDESTPGGGNPENVIDMATDYNGNVYTLSRVYGKSTVVPAAKIDVEGNIIPNYGVMEILLTSFNCKGAYRWSKLIGTKSGGDVGVALKTDDYGGVYVTGRYHSYTYAGTDDGPLNIDTDSIIARNNKNFFLVKYDTAGLYQWVRTPEPDTLQFVFSRSPVVLGSTSVEMEIDNEGDVYVLSFLSPGAFANGAYIVTDPGMTYHMLVYSRSGIFKKGYKMDIACPSKDGAFNQGFDNIKMSLDKTRRKWYLSGWLQKGFTGEDSMSLGGINIKGSVFLSRFNEAGKMEWLKENSWASVNNVASRTRPVIDKFSNIYTAGAASPANTFNGYTFINPVGVSSVFYLMKMDSSGKRLWTKASTANASAAGHMGLAISGNTVGLKGMYVGKMTWDTYFYNWTTGATYIPYFARFNSITGSVFGIDTLAAKVNGGFMDQTLTVDRFSNFYLGGGFLSENDLKVGPNNLVSYGGKSDVYVAKHGRDNCDCSTAPTAKYTYAKTTGSGLAKFTFTGTTPSDSVVWYFGDGTEATGATPSHTYPSATDNYTACVVVYNRCGSDVYCQQVTAGSGIEESITGSIRVYPNPAMDFVTIDGLNATTEISLMNTFGQQIIRETTGNTKHSVSLKGLASGIYLLQFKMSSGEIYSTKIVKQ